MGESSELSVHGRLTWEKEVEMNFSSASVGAVFNKHDLV